MSRIFFSKRKFTFFIEMFSYLWRVFKLLYTLSAFVTVDNLCWKTHDYHKYFTIFSRLFSIPLNKVHFTTWKCLTSWRVKGCYKIAQHDEQQQELSFLPEHSLHSFPEHWTFTPESFIHISSRMTETCSPRFQWMPFSCPIWITKASMHSSLDLRDTITGNSWNWKS